MRKRLFVALLALSGVASVGGRVDATHAAATVAPTTLSLTKVGTSSFKGGVASPDPAVDMTEIDQATVGDTDASDGVDFGAGVNRSPPTVVTGRGRSINPNKKAKSNPALGTHFQGLNFHDQRFANGGKQFSVEPPDQALCAGGGYLFEAVNDVVQVYDTSGTPLLNGGQAVDLNTFFGYAPAIDRSTGKYGPSITDPTCLFDQASQRFFFVVLTLDRVGTSSSLSGTNHLDIAVSDTANPTGSWTIYKLAVQNNGTQGTPNHGCNNGFCLGDYPHIGADANGIYLTTNEFAFFGPSYFYGAQVYATSKAALVAGSPGPVVLFDTLGATPEGAGFTVWPAQSPGTNFDLSNGGTEHFLSSNAVFSPLDIGTSNNIYVWSLSNSLSLNSATPAPNLQFRSILVNNYAVPPLATQKAGDRPLSQCIADTTTNCNIAVAGVASHNNTTWGPPNGKLNANDSRFGQVVYANGKLWGALGTAVNLGGADRAGIAYYVVNPSSGKLILQGQAGVPSTDLTYPTVGVTDSGRGIVSFTLTGDNDYPSAAYAPLDALVGMGDVAVAQAGAGPWDGFTSYVVYNNGPRWGDYGATAVVGNTIWAASEYIAQSCTYAQYLVTPIGQCGGTRGALGNWSTHISKITP